HLRASSHRDRRRAGGRDDEKDDERNDGGTKKRRATRPRAARNNTPRQESDAPRGGSRSSSSQAIHRRVPRRSARLSSSHDRDPLLAFLFLGFRRRGGLGRFLALELGDLLLELRLALSRGLSALLRLFLLRGSRLFRLARLFLGLRGFLHARKRRGELLLRLL